MRAGFEAATLGRFQTSAVSKVVHGKETGMRTTASVASSGAMCCDRDSMKPWGDWFDMLCFMMLHWPFGSRQSIGGTFDVSACLRQALRICGVTKVSPAEAMEQPGKWSTSKALHHMFGGSYRFLPKRF